MLMELKKFCPSIFLLVIILFDDIIYYSNANWNYIYIIYFSKAIENVHKYLFEIIHFIVLIIHN